MSRGYPGQNRAMSQPVHEHKRAFGASHSVTPLELFFDLVFVFALTQVTTLLADDLTWVGLLRGFAVLAVVWWAWGGYAWLTNTINIDDDVASRLVLLIAMVAMLIVGLATPAAFGEYALLFGVAYFVVRCLHVLLYAVTTRTDPEVFGAVVRLAPGLLAGATLILIAGFLPAGPLRGGLWALAILVDFVTPLFAGTKGWKVDAGHFAERHSLIVIIALGESLIALGLSASSEKLTAGVITAAALGVLVIAAMWWLYFDIVAVVAEQRLAALTGQAQARMARDSYTYLHLPMVIGIVLVALGLKKTLVEIDTPLTLIVSISLFGGLALYLLAHIAFRLRNIRTLNVQRLIAAIVLLLLIPAGANLPALVSLGLATAVLIVLVCYETIRFRDTRHRIRFHHHD